MSEEQNIILGLGDNYTAFKTIIDEILNHPELYPDYEFDKFNNIVGICKLMDEREFIGDIIFSFFKKEIQIGNYLIHELRQDFTFNILDHRINNYKISWLLIELKNKMDFDGETFEDILMKHEEILN